MPDFECDPWRLGHRRPWWQWNVITLMVALFALVWLRELLPLTVDESLAIGMFGGLAVLTGWIVMPLLHPTDRTARIRFQQLPLWKFRILSWLVIVLMGIGVLVGWFVPVYCMR